jgi:NAD+ kinase
MDEPHKMKFGIFGNTGKTEVFQAIEPVLKYFVDEDIFFCIETDVAAHLDPRLLSSRQEPVIAGRKEISRLVDVIITFGGDGTMLAAAQVAMESGTPLFGVNVGKLGFLADINTDESLHAIDRILRGEYAIEERGTLEGRFEQHHSSFSALNDIVISKSGKARVIHIDAYVDGDFLASFFADGIIVSTPTGSTAYSLATGGPVVVPSSHVVIISPISAHTLTARPIIIPADCTIRISAVTEEGTALVMADGQVICEENTTQDIHITRGRFPVKLVKHVGSDYFEMLRTKLHWAQDSRFHPRSK